MSVHYVGDQIMGESLMNVPLGTVAAQQNLAATISHSPPRIDLLLLFVQEVSLISEERLAQNLLHCYGQFVLNAPSQL